MIEVCLSESSWPWTKRNLWATDIETVTWLSWKKRAYGWALSQQKFTEGSASKTGRDKPRWAIETKRREFFRKKAMPNRQTLLRTDKFRSRKVSVGFNSPRRHCWLQPGLQWSGKGVTNSSRLQGNARRGKEPKTDNSWRKFRWGWGKGRRKSGCRTEMGENQPFTLFQLLKQEKRACLKRWR